MGILSSNKAMQADGRYAAAADRQTVMLTQVTESMRRSR